MSFPYHDRAWLEALGTLLVYLDDDDTVLAPDRFWWALPTPVHRWVRANFGADSHHDWAIVHKGELSWVPRRFLLRLRDEHVPFFANEVFVILGPPDRGLPFVTADENHLTAFDRTVEGLSEDPIPDNPYESDRAIRDAPVLTRFAALDDGGLRGQQEEFFDAGGYEYPTRRDEVYFREVHELVAETMERWADADVLDVACGGVPAGDVDPTTRVVRFDLSANGVARAAEVDAALANVHHAAADAHRLPFPDGRFDAVTFVDAIEHVADAATVLAEIARVLRPGGELFVTYANTQSMNQVMMRRLGYPQFLTNHQHIAEFSPTQMRELLASAGLEVVTTGGISLYPYWGIPGIDDLVRALTDDDEEVVEMLRYAGRAIGDRHAYTGTVLARKVGGTPS